MPLLTYRASTSGGDNTFGANNVVTTAPTTVAGDLEVLWATVAALAPASPAAFTTPSGWNLGGSSSVFPLVGGALNIRLYLYWRIAPGTGSAATLQTSPATNSAMGYARLSYANPDASTPFGQVTFGDLASSSSLVVPSLTTSESRALTNIFISQGAAQSITPPGTMTERVDNTTYGTSVADEQRATAGATGTRTFTPAASADAVWGYAEFHSASVHASSGVLTGPGSSIAGSAARTRAHAGSGALTGQGSSLSGSAARTRQHATSGVLEGQGSALAGSAARTRQHASSGDLTGPGASLSGASARTRQHGASGDLLGPGAVIVGSADHASPAGNHDATGALVGQGSALSGAAARTRAFASSGALVGPGSVVAGAAARSGTPVSHDASGALVGPGSIVSGTAQVGEDQTLTGGFLWMLRRRKAWEEALRSVPEPVAEVIKAEAPKVIEKPKAQARNELRKALELENLPYRAAYTQALERLVQQMRQEQEDDEEEESVAEALLYIL